MISEESSAKRSTRMGFTRVSVIGITTYECEALLKEEQSKS